MTNLGYVVQQLRRERVQTQKRIEQLDQALEALTGVNTVRGTRRRSGGVSNFRETENDVSCSTKRIAAAQRARWAKWKAAQQRK